MQDISPNADVIDVRDVIERYEELATWAECTVCSEPCELGPKTWIHSHSQDMYCGTGDGAMASPTILDQDEADELQALTELLAELKGNGGDEQWNGDWYPVTLIRDSYFREYAVELADEIGAVDSNAGWPNNCIDWEEAARELRMDYSSVEYAGITYWYR
jgi:hypothetical protein